MRTTRLPLLRSLFAISDEQAMWRLQTQGDEHAFAHLMRRWERPIQRLCARMTGDSHRGQDLAQEVFVRVFARRKDYVPSGRFSTWLWRIALNLCHDELRRVQRRAEFSLEGAAEQEDGNAALDLPSREPWPDDAAAAGEQGEWVRRALRQLPEPYRTVLVLRHYEDLKFREIAEVLEVPEGTVKSRMAEALTQMNRLLEPLMTTERARKPDPLTNLMSC
jgi:RNA polymerase sigma-70 factor, ECF subfamily